MGLFDSIMGTADWMFNNKYDLDYVECTKHVRHALALLEKRWLYRPTRFENDERSVDDDEDGIKLGYGPERSCREAWFFGRHGNMGGSSADDGLALWPLQWILGEAESFGLVLDDGKRLRVGTDDKDEGGSSLPLQHPLEYVRPDGSLKIDIEMENRYKFALWGLGGSFISPGFDDKPDEMNFFTAGPKYHERLIFDEYGRLIGYRKNEPHRSALIHPSVMLHYNSSPEAVRPLDKLECISHIRSFEQKMKFPAVTSLYSSEVEGPDSRARYLDRRYIRTLVCGTCGSGKSHLINSITGETLAIVSDGARPVNHNIEIELIPSRMGTEDDPQFIFHDSQGFEQSREEQLHLMEDFVKRRRTQPSFPEHVHCIWYCIEAHKTRYIQDSDIKLFRDLQELSGLSVIVVFTMCDRMKRECKAQAEKEVAGVTDEWGEVDESMKARVIARAKQLYEEGKAEKREFACDYLGQGTQCVFVSNSKEGFEELKAATRSALTDHKLLKIYNVAVKYLLDEIIPSAVKVSMEWLRASRESDKSQYLPTRQIQDEVLAELQTRLIQPGVFGISLPNISVSDTQPSALFGPNNQAHPISDVLTVKAKMILATFTGAPALVAGAGSLVNTGSLGTPLGVISAGVVLASTAAKNHMKGSVLYTNNVQKLVAAASAILLFERVFWYGGQEPSLALLMRAAVKGIHLMPKLDEVAEARFKGNNKLFGGEFEEKVLGEMVRRFRFDYVKELEDQDNNSHSGTTASDES